MISEGNTDDNANWVRKRHSRAKCMDVKAREVESGPILGFGPRDLEGLWPLTTVPWSLGPP